MQRISDCIVPKARNHSGQTPRGFLPQNRLPVNTPAPNRQRATWLPPCQGTTVLWVVFSTSIVFSQLWRSFTTKMLCPVPKSPHELMLVDFVVPQNYWGHLTCLKPPQQEVHIASCTRCFVPFTPQFSGPIYNICWLNHEPAKASASCSKLMSK